MTTVLGRIADDVWELLDGLVPEEKEKEEEMEEMEVEEMEMMEETGARMERDRDEDMEVEEMLKEVEKSVDEAERVERDVME